MRYFFDISDHSGRSVDRNGLDYDDHFLALHDAKLTAISILRDAGLRSRADVTVHVRNDEGMVGEITAALTCHTVFDTAA